MSAASALLSLTCARCNVIEALRATPRLIDEAKKARLAWCLEREHWTLKD
jgi:hypothetical protein